MQPTAITKNIGVMSSSSLACSNRITLIMQVTLTDPNWITKMNLTVIIPT